MLVEQLRSVYLTPMLATLRLSSKVYMVFFHHSVGTPGCTCTRNTCSSPRIWLLFYQYHSI